MDARLRPVGTCAVRRVSRLLGELENLTQRFVGATEVAAVHIRVREKQGEPQFPEAIAVGTGLVQ